MIDDFKEVQNTGKVLVKKPVVVTVFGICNVIIGFYELARISPGVSRIMTAVFKNPEKITWEIMLFLLLGLVGFGLIIWLIVLGVGLLTMKRWARRGSVLYGWINVVFIVLILGATVVSSIIDWENAPRILRGSINIGNGLVVIQWIYMVLMLVFMKSAKVKKAFATVGG